MIEHHTNAFELVLLRSINLTSCSSKSSWPSYALHTNFFSIEGTLNSRSLALPIVLGRPRLVTPLALPGLYFWSCFQGVETLLQLLVAWQMKSQVPHTHAHGNVEMPRVIRHSTHHLLWKGTHLTPSENVIFYVLAARHFNFLGMATDWAPSHLLFASSI